ncbi:PEP-CTERM sorting domain-containing protein [Paludibaculum fermentans]|uniref:PEP-CTERM sorting domain-containing protein n=1 Tax=Paludibaculum fermentans TaxID=1473598 RepID=A0A7S7NQ46_PALFE|nr:PEP-CTERM sorting domain-containing protein [Paludibaculum fermentans]QOY87736.1 PEP-CTERM sorting domain-containing protein [Paludibaculum fermentans]
MKLAALCLALVLGALCPQAGASTLQLTQGGWDQGGPLTILFTGVDTDLSGGIDTAELTAFSASFQLDGGGIATLTLADLGSDGFYYASPADYFVKADGPLYSLYEIAFAGSVFGALSDSTSVVAITGAPLQVDGASAVPEPGTALIVGLPLVLLGLRRRKSAPHCGS